jgi:hypothetical protein
LDDVVLDDASAPQQAAQNAEAEDCGKFGAFDRKPAIITPSIQPIITATQVSSG